MVRFKKKSYNNIACADSCGIKPKDINDVKIENRGAVKRYYWWKLVGVAGADQSLLIASMIALELGVKVIVSSEMLSGTARSMLAMLAHHQPHRQNQNSRLTG
jgi:hypothetical protein